MHTHLHKLQTSMSKLNSPLKTMYTFSHFFYSFKCCTMQYQYSINKHFCTGKFAKEIYTASASHLWFGPGQRFSSTSPGSGPLACLTHPWKASTVISKQTFSIAWRRLTQIYRSGSHAFHHHAEKKSSMGFKKGEYAG